MTRKSSRAQVPPALVERVGGLLLALPKVVEEDAWVGVRWRISGRTVAHLFGGEDGLIRITFRGDPQDVLAFPHLGDAYFKVGWGDDVIGMVLDESTDFDEVREFLTISYLLLAPATLAAEVEPTIDRE